MELKPEVIKAIRDSLIQPAAKQEIHMSDAQVICARLELLFGIEFPSPQAASKPNEPIAFIAVNNVLIPYLDMRISMMSRFKLGGLISTLAPAIYKEMQDE
jgi:hypothetical protein